MGFALDTGVLHWSGPGRSGWFWTAWLVALHCTTTIRSTLPASGDWTSSSDRMMGPHAKNRKNKIKKKTGATGSIVLIRPPTPDPSLQQPRPRFFLLSAASGHRQESHHLAGGGGDRKGRRVAGLLQPAFASALRATFGRFFHDRSQSPTS